MGREKSWITKGQIEKLQAEARAIVTEWAKTWPEEYGRDDQPLTLDQVVDKFIADEDGNAYECAEQSNDTKIVGAVAFLTTRAKLYKASSLTVPLTKSDHEYNVCLLDDLAATARVKEYAAKEDAEATEAALAIENFRAMVQS